MRNFFRKCLEKLDLEKRALRKSHDRLVVDYGELWNHQQKLLKTLKDYQLEIEQLKKNK